jgi:hypothetical protein
MTFVDSSGRLPHQRPLNSRDALDAKRFNLFCINATELSVWPLFDITLMRARQRNCGP